MPALPAPWGDVLSGAGRYLSEEGPAMVRCACCCAGFCTVWWYLVFVCWMGGSFCLLRRLLSSSMLQWSASVPDALIGELTRCCAGNGAGGYRTASLQRDPVTRPMLEQALHTPARESGRCVRVQRWRRDEGRHGASSKVVQTRGIPDLKVEHKDTSRSVSSRRFSCWSAGEEMLAKSLSYKS